MNKSCCAACTFLDIENNKCTNENGKLKNIELSEDLLNAEHDCHEFNEVTYVLTPKGCLNAAFIKAGLMQYPEGEEVFEEVWENFVEAMKKFEYIHEEDENQK